MKRSFVGVTGARGASPTRYPTRPLKPGKLSAPVGLKRQRRRQPEQARDRGKVAHLTGPILVTRPAAGAECPT